MLTAVWRHRGSVLTVFTVLLLSACTNRTEVAHSAPDVLFQTLDGQKIAFELIAVAMPFDPPKYVLEYAESQKLLSTDQTTWQGRLFNTLTF